MDSTSDASITVISVSQTVNKGLQIDLSPLNNVLKNYSFNTEVFSSLGQNINAYLKSILPVINLQQNINELLKPHMEMMQRLSSSIAALLPNIEIPESLIKNLGNINYLNLLREIKWPLFLEDDDSLRTQLENLCEHYTKDYPLDNIAELVCNYYDSSRLDDFFDTWSQITDDKNLLEMLRQALGQIAKHNSYTIINHYREYNSNHEVVLEIGYHHEKSIGHGDILHVHVHNTPEVEHHGQADKFVIKPGHPLYEKHKKLFKGVKQ
ncbi:hypothetical protein JCM13267_06140 [Howardella ureilytica]